MSFEDLLREAPNIANFRTKGVYLWTDVDGSLNYIGKALGKPDLVKRQQDHYLSLIGGCSVIPARYRKVERQWSKGNKFDYPDVILDRDKFKELVDSAFDYLNDIKVWLCPLPHLANSEIEELEKVLIYEFQPWCNTMSTKTKPDSDISFTMQGDRPEKIG